ncbi:efflux transporter outer membrane subunit [Sphingobacterium yanglingense]|uniref:NodT family efflux transporter outer membrane factor (OMF) lipoprotein n=1 Tax=Sphingobacterium yanglingense TaxID=1437280 RepID=A0A4R6WI63_9SPHI|nr:efflux transporter outer membrane subunit [Sphingobacterium yanglingense]TDQ75148.1 NodT family efflux transporter outer membrane factor (OMF) lipoprotein [Sphingobacterium yanglingense]
MSIKAVLYLFTIFFILTGCKVGEKYKQPNLNIPASFRSAETTSEGDASLSQIEWRNFFNDSNLITLIDSGLSHNYDMRIALKNIEIANRNLRINKLNYLPTVDANIATVNQQYRSKDFYGSASSKWYEQKGEKAPESMAKYQSQYATGLEFSWELDIWGRIGQEGDVLKASWMDTKEAKTAIQTKLIADIATGYFNLLMLDAQIEVAKRNLQLNDSTLRMIKLQFDAGEITALAIQQTESQRLVAASLIPDLEKEITIQENSLRMLVGDMPAAVYRSSTLNDSLINFDQDISLGSPLDIIRNRPDIKQAEYALVAANAQMNIAQIMRYPSISLSGVFGVNAMLAKNWFNIPGALLGGIAGGVTAPVFRNKKLKNQYEVAKIEREKAELDFQRQVMEAVGEVSNTIITVEKQKEQLLLAQERVSNSELAVKNASLLFKSGYATYLEVITAQSNALKSELDLVELKQRQLNACVALYRSLGGGWQ